MIDPVCGMSVDPATAKGTYSHHGNNYHFCSIPCLKKFQNDPDKYLAGHRERMDAPPDLHAVPSSGVRYVCPMHPEVTSDRPGACPKCGMALEPATPTLDEQPDPEAADMSRRLWISVALGVPLLLIAMLDMTPAQPATRWFGSSGSLIVQWLLCTPVVLWCGWPFFVRARILVASATSTCLP